MFNDPIVAETRKAREQMASEHGFDVRRLGRHFMDEAEARPEGRCGDS